MTDKDTVTLDGRTYRITRRLPPFDVDLDDLLVEARIKRNAVDFGLWPNNRYGVIYADPPWNFETYSDKGTGRGAVSHYDTLTIEDLMTMPVADLAAKDCALFLCTHLPQGLELLRAWGFDYKTVGFVWAKKNTKANSYFMGLGKWTRTNPEICLLATRGKPKPLSRSVRKLVVERLRENGRKPERVRDDIKELVAGPYLELFARQTAEGWDCWGDQTTLFDQGHVETRRQPSSLSASPTSRTKSSGKRKRSRTSPSNLASCR